MTVPYPYSTLKCVRETAEHWWFHCVFHKGDNEASLCVNKTTPYKFFYRCWACNENGSAFDFAKRMKLSTDNIPPITDAATIVERRYRPKVDWKDRLCYDGSNIFLRFADKVGVSVETLDKFKIGFYNGRYLIPMYDKQGICGIQQRWYEEGKCHKRCQRYSKHGWFVPANINSYNFYRDYQDIFITEGWSDAAVILELGYLAIGRFNALTVTSCPVHLNQFIKVYIMSDTDECGIRGAKKLQKLIPNNKIIIPPIATNSYKDIRELYLTIGKEKTKEWLKEQLKN